MDLPFVVFAFLFLAVLLAGGILVAVALPRLRGSDEEERSAEDRRHTSRTKR
ncbi:hypothetical protein [Brachybacterium saurashtrense]|uniref:hypothetical protein n=1 Tax=Brachybacterium saurashtrense TaxID=556288 RepID=UPI0013B35AD7|nr:hypothetical protein [Brachybacterium saurashtrense]